MTTSEAVGTTQKMARASCVERLRLALAQLWCVSLECQAEARQEGRVSLREPGADLPEKRIARRKRIRPARQLPLVAEARVVRGRLLLLAMQVQGQPFSVGILRLDI